MCLSLRPTPARVALPVVEVLVPVHPAPGPYVVHGTRVGGEDLELRAGGKGLHALLGADHRQRAEEPQGVQAGLSGHVQIHHSLRIWWGGSGATSSTSPLPSGASTLTCTRSASLPWL